MRRLPPSLCIGSVLLACAGAAAAEDPSDNPYFDLSLEELVQVRLIGQGEARQVQAIAREDTGLLLPGTSPLKAIEKLPGVHFVSADAWGNYEWSVQLSIRGFRQDQLGYTLDGVPLGDMTYSNNNGLHISRALIAENFKTVELAQGSGSVSTASTSNLGGTLRFVARDPEPDAELQIAQSLGSDQGRRSFVRWDSGEHAGLSFMLSLADAETDKWKGAGQQEHFQFNGKSLYRWREHRLWAFYNSSRRKEADYMDLSLDSQQRLGWDWDYYYPDWTRAVEAAQGQFRGAVTSLDDAYFSGRGLRNDELAALGGEFALSPSLQLKTGLYRHHNLGQGHWHSPYTASSATVPISVRTTEYLIARNGVTVSLGERRGRHEWQAGLWYEDNYHELARNFYYIDGPVATDHMLRDPDVRVFEQHFDTRTLQLHVRDRLSLLDEHLQFDIGIRSLEVDSRSQAVVGTLAGGRLKVRDHFLPQVGVRYRWPERPLEAFLSYSENIAAFNTGRDGPFNAEQSAFDATVEQLLPESSRTVEAGLRYSAQRLAASVAIYQVTFNNRLLSIAQCAGIIGCTSSFANVGAVHTQGIELTARWRPRPSVVWLNTLSINDSRYRDDYRDGIELIAIADKQVVNTPRRLFASEWVWQQAPWEARLAAKFTDSRFITYTNDTQVPGFWRLDAAVAYQFAIGRWARDARLQLNVSNLLDQRYFATVGSNGFAAADPNGRQYTLLAGAPRQVFLSLALKF